MDNFYDYIRERSSWSGCKQHKWHCDKYLDCDKCLEDKIKEHEKQIKAEAIDEELQSFAQWLWDSNYLVDETFTIKLVEQYKTEQLREQKKNGRK